MIFDFCQCHVGCRRSNKQFISKSGWVRTQKNTWDPRPWIRWPYTEKDERKRRRRMQIGVVYTNTDHVEEVFLGRRDGITECRRRRADDRQAFMNTERTKTSLTAASAAATGAAAGTRRHVPSWWLPIILYVVRLEYSSIFLWRKDAWRDVTTGMAVTSALVAVNNEVRPTSTAPW